MAYFLYDSYCYSSIQDASASFFSRGAIDGMGVFQSYTVGSSSATYILLSSSISTNGNSGKVVQATSSFTYTFPSCGFPGHDMPFLGLRVDDAFAISMAMVGLMLIAASYRHVVDLIKGHW